MIRERVVDGERIVTVDTEEESAQAIAPEAFGVFPEDVGSEEVRRKAEELKKGYLEDGFAERVVEEPRESSGYAATVAHRGGVASAEAMTRENSHDPAPVT